MNSTPLRPNPTMQEGPTPVAHTPSALKSTQPSSIPPRRCRCRRRQRTVREGRTGTDRTGRGAASLGTQARVAASDTWLQPVDWWRHRAVRRGLRDFRAVDRAT
ncbi:hypothetical protein [Robbsia andropogonis]|uniref:hypothetical protein n=1 Tax=Robbsia andropogonis TaxID=28092 RepID=UPI002A6A21D8|nr:hypothetical protein [Robbsia andropogonis]